MTEGNAMPTRVKIVTVLAALLVVGVGGVALAAPSLSTMDGAPRWGMMDSTDRVMPGNQAQMREWHDQMHADPGLMGQHLGEMHGADPQMQRHMDGRDWRGPDGSSGAHCSGAGPSTT